MSKGDATLRRAVKTKLRSQIRGGYQQELMVARRLGRLAGRAVLGQRVDDLRIWNKDLDQGVVTDADHIANHIICSGLRLAFAEDEILSEENAVSSTDLRAQRMWVVDPLDGTTGLIDGSGEYAIQIGLVVGGQVVLGVVYLPAVDQLYSAARGCGTWVALSGSPPQRVRVSATAEVARARVVSSRAHRTPAMASALATLGFHDELCRHSVGVKVAALVEQECDVYLHVSGGTKWWDTCAPEIILTEAGGSFTDLFGRPLVYSGADLENTCGILASNGILHKTIVLQLAPVLQGTDGLPLPI